jgi:signal transduction histidine kinase
MDPPSAYRSEHSALAARESRSVGFARAIGLVGMGYALWALTSGGKADPLWPLALQAVVATAVALVAFLSPSVPLVSAVLLAAIGSSLFAFLFARGTGGGTGALLICFPVACSVPLHRPRAAQAVTALSCIAFSGAVWWFPSQSSSWPLAILSFLALATIAALLLGAVLRDFDQVFFKYEEASSALATAGRLRIAAEEARDKALLLRSESRSVEALGVVAGSVVHDLNNMAQVIRTWTGEILRDEASGTAHDAALSIAGACDRVTTLASDVLALGQSETEAAYQSSLSDIMPKAARALRRYVPESIRLILDQGLPDGLPPFPLTGADLVHLVLEAAAMLNVSSATSGTLMVAAPVTGELDVAPPHSGMSRYPVVLLLELRRDAKTRTKAAPWRDISTLPEEGKDVLCTSEVCVLFFSPYRDALVIVFDLFPTLHADPGHSTRFLALPPASTRSARPEP